MTALSTSDPTIGPELKSWERRVIDRFNAISERKLIKVSPGAEDIEPVDCDLVGRSGHTHGVVEIRVNHWLELEPFVQYGVWDNLAKGLSICDTSKECMVPGYLFHYFEMFDILVGWLVCDECGDRMWKWKIETRPSQTSLLDKRKIPREQFNLPFNRGVVFIENFFGDATCKVRFAESMWPALTTGPT